MTDSEKLAQIEAYVLKYVNNHDYYNDEDFDPYSYSGGNCDDAFSMGDTQGRGDFAREIYNFITKGVFRS